MSANGYLFSAYLLIWILLFCYLVFLHRRQRRIADELADLEETGNDPRAGNGDPL